MALYSATKWNERMFNNTPRGDSPKRESETHMEMVAREVLSNPNERTALLNKFIIEFGDVRTVINSFKGCTELPDTIQHDRMSSFISSFQGFADKLSLTLKLLGTTGLHFAETAVQIDSHMHGDREQPSEVDEDELKFNMSSADTIREEAHDDADIIRAEAHEDADIIRAEAYEDADNTRAEAHEDADNTRAEAHEDADNTRAEARVEAGDESSFIMNLAQEKADRFRKAVHDAIAHDWQVVQAELKQRRLRCEKWCVKHKASASASFVSITARAFAKNMTQDDYDSDSGASDFDFDVDVDTSDSIITIIERESDGELGSSDGELGSSDGELGSESDGELGSESDGELGSEADGEVGSSDGEVGSSDGEVGSSDGERGSEADGERELESDGEVGSSDSEYEFGGERDSDSKQTCRREFAHVFHLLRTVAIPQHVSFTTALAKGEDTSKFGKPINCGVNRNKLCNVGFTVDQLRSSKPCTIEAVFRDVCSELGELDTSPNKDLVICCVRTTIEQMAAVISDNALQVSNHIERAWSAQCIIVDLVMTLYDTTHEYSDTSVKFITNHLNSKPKAYKAFQKVAPTTCALVSIRFSRK